MKKQSSKPIVLKLRFNDQNEVLNYFREFGEYMINKLDTNDKELFTSGAPEIMPIPPAHNESISDKRGKHMRELHRLAKEHKEKNPDMKYRDCLKCVSKTK